MTLHLPLIVVLGLAVWLIWKFFRLRIWVVVVIVLFGFYLANTFLAPTIDATTKTGVQTVNQHH